MADLDPKLVAEILERPLDDGPRLVLADALQERADPRGQFIVMQCRLTHRGLAPGDRSNLSREVAKLLAEHQSRWAAAAEGLDFKMRRGFIDEVTASAGDLLSPSAKLFDSEPVTRLTLTGVTAANVKPLASFGVFARVLRLTICGSLGDDGARVVAQALGARKTPLHSLNVGCTGIEAGGAAALAEALEGCRSIAFTSNALGDKGLAAIAKAKTLTKLETLYLTDTELTDEGVAAFAKSTTLVSLSRLALARNEEVTAESLAALASSRKLKKLRWLEYSNEDGYQAVAARVR